MYNDYAGYEPSFDEPRGSPHIQNKNQWTNTPRVKPPPICHPQPGKFSREFSDELSNKLMMRQMNKESMVGPSIEVMKRKFEGEKLKKQNSSISGSYTKSSQIINNSLEESYWAHWKPPPITVASNWSEIKPDSSIRERSQFTACSNRCNPDSIIPSNEGRMKLLDEKSLKILRKPMDMIESNSSEGDKNIQGKLYHYIASAEVNNTEIPPPSVKCYQPPVPTFTMSMPNYQSVFYYASEDQKYRDRVKPCRRKEMTQQYFEKDKFMSNSPRNDKKADQDSANPEIPSSPKCRKRHQHDTKKRPKSVEKKQQKFKVKGIQTKSDDKIPCNECTNTEPPKNRVRFFTKKHLEDANDEEDETDTFCTMKDSTRSIDGYHGDIDTESYQVRDRGTLCCDCDDSYEEGQGDLDTDTCEMRRYTNSYDQDDDIQDDDTYNYNCPCYHANCCSVNHRCCPSEEDSYISKSDNGYKPHSSHVPMYRNEGYIRYPDNRYRNMDRNDGRELSTSSLCCSRTALKESSFTSTSKSERNGILKVREGPRILNNEVQCMLCYGNTEILREKCCGTPSPAAKAVCACNTEPKVCVNKSCETLEKIMKEKKTGEDSPCCLKVINEHPENDRGNSDPSSSTKSDESRCKCCGDCCNNSTSTSSRTGSSDVPKPSNESSKDTMAVALVSSKDDIPDEESFPTDDIDHKVTCEFHEGRSGSKSTDPSGKTVDNASSTNPTNPITSSSRSTEHKATTIHCDDGIDVRYTADATSCSCTPESVQNQDSGSVAKSLEKDPEEKNANQRQTDQKAEGIDKNASKSALVHVHYGTSGDSDSLNSQTRKETSDIQKNESSIKREASVNTSLRHGRSYDGIRHYVSQEKELVLHVDTTDANQPFLQETVHDIKEYNTMSRPFIVLPSEARNSTPAMLAKSLILQRSARSPVQNRAALKGHTYTLKTPIGSGRTARSPKRKR